QCGEARPRAPRRRSEDRNAGDPHRPGRRRGRRRHDRRVHGALGGRRRGLAAGRDARRAARSRPARARESRPDGSRACRRVRHRRSREPQRARRTAVSRRRAGRDADGRAGGRQHRPRHRGRAAARVPLPESRQHGDDRAEVGDRRPAGRAAERGRRLARVAVRAHHEPCRLPQPHHRHDPVGVGVLHVSARCTPDHQQRHFRRMTRGAVATVVLAVPAAVVPVPAGLVERWYSSLAYPAIQRVVTPLSNAVPFALFDALCLAALCGFAVAAYRRIRRFGWRRGSLRLAWLAVVSAAAIYLAFLATWGLNYRRVPILEKVAFDRARIRRSAATDLGDVNAATLNRLFAAAHADALSLDALASSFDDAIGRMGARTAIVPGRPKQTLLGAYFHEISAAGMTDPFFLETLVAPDLFDVERPFVIAHEWAHLAGYADESEANFIAWLT